MDFSKHAGANQANNLIPKGQLAWAIINYRGYKNSNSGGGYLDVELVIDDDQPFARRKIWEMIGDPHNPGNSEGYRDMGARAITHILEAARGAGPENPAGYQLPGDAPAAYQALHGLRVPIKIKIEEGKDGYEDKNKVAEWLTPNPQSKSHKAYKQLLAGVYNTNAGAVQPSVQPTMFGGAASAQPAAMPTSWGAPPPQPPAAPPAQAAPPPAATSATPPSSAAPNPNGWLAQAQKPAA